MDLIKSPFRTPSETREFDDDLLEREFEEELHARASPAPKTHGSGPSTVDKNAIKARIAQIRMQIMQTSSDYDREKLQERLAKLNRGVLARSFDEMELLEREYYDKLD